MEIPSDLVAKTLHALADADLAPEDERTVAFVSVVDDAMRLTVERFLRAIGKVKPKIETYGIADVNKSLDRLSTGKVRYRAVLRHG